VPFDAVQSDPKLRDFALASTELKPGQVSEPLPTEDGSSMVVYLQARGKPDAAGLPGFEKHIRASDDDRLRTLVFSDWASWKSKQPGTRKPPQLELYGSIE
jgi:hypothetical protein